MKNALRNHEYKRLSPMENARHRNKFKKIKSNLIAEWEERTGQRWPVNKEEIISPEGKVIIRAGQKYDVHHIIESSYGGDNAWWNIHPARNPDIHQAGIHGSGSPASRLF
jgi:predicted ribonuclease toxin of YeeF-YezG toxin-antitoxin module